GTVQLSRRSCVGAGAPGAPSRVWCRPAENVQGGPTARKLRSNAGAQVQYAVRFGMRISGRLPRVASPLIGVCAIALIITRCGGADSTAPPPSKSTQGEPTLSIQAGDAQT